MGQLILSLKLKGGEREKVNVIISVTAELGLTIISKDTATGAVVFRPTLGAAVAYTGEFQIVIERGAYADVHDAVEVFAENGSHVCGYSGSIIRARLGSLVNAEEGATVFAENGSFVTAYEGSAIEAFYGAQIKARFGSYVIKHLGALVDRFCGCTVVDSFGKTISHIVETGTGGRLMGR